MISLLTGVGNAVVMPMVRLVLLVFAISVMAPTPAGGDAGPTPLSSSSAVKPARGGANVLWSEFFRGPLDWRDPEDHSAALRARVYSVEQEAGTSFLRAHHDATSKGAPAAIHFGKAFDGIPLQKVRLIRWRWRARTQPLVQSDPWQDMAASIYVVTKAPGFLRKGRGFKFGWLAKPGPSQTYQRGLLQVPLRSDPPSPQWQSEQVDLCALYRRTFGPCEDEQIIYIGVVTDADGTKSVAEGDYADFEVVGR